jgi:SAM-dependent methyltransferase
VGIRQFLDLGSGLPAQGNVHEVAQEIAPQARVVYIDSDPVVLAHARALLVGDHTAVVTADIREPGSILNHPAVGGLIDFDQPVGLLMFAILHHVNDFEGPGRIAATFREAVPPGSHLAISHFQNPGDARPEDAEMALLGEELFNRSFGTGRWRTPEEIRSYFGDWELLEPGVVPMPEWRPDIDGIRKKDLTHYLFVGGVAKKL